MNAIDQFWQYIVTGVAAIGWFFRLEAKANSAHARIDAINAQRHDDMQAIMQARADTNATLAIIQADIKTLLREAGKGGN
ncbi:MAG: hypothetical protein ACK5PF_02575 [bacterium]